MNTVNPYLKQYQKSQLETASPEQILIMLYDAAIQFLVKARAAMEEKNIQETHDNITKCEKIILEFMNSLDMKNGGEIAQNLYNLYDYLYETLSYSNRKKDLEKLDEVSNHLKGLRETWQKAIAIANAERAALMSENDGVDKYERTEDEDYEDEDDDEDEE